MMLIEAITAVSREFGITERDIMGASRLKPTAQARHAFVLIARKEQFSLTDIGNFLGGRDHTTILNSENRGFDLLLAGGDWAEKFRRAHTRIGKLTFKSVRGQAA